MFRRYSVQMLAVLGVALPLTLVGCQGREGAEGAGESDAISTAPATGEQEVAGVNETPGDLNPIEAQMAVDDVTIGHQLGADGAMAEGQGGDDFAPGDPIYIAMEVGDTPAGSAVKVVWYGPNETRLGEDTKTVNAGESYINFQQTNTASWAQGDYRAEVWIGDEKVNEQQFQIVPPGQQGR